MKDSLFDIWFALRCGPGCREFTAVLDACGDPYAVFNADENELDRLPCGDRLKRALADKSLDEPSRILDYCRANGVTLLFWQDPGYPASLRSLLDPPVLLYCTGRLPDFARQLCVGVVGTRRMSEYGRRMAYKIGFELSAAGAVVVSGLALGIDSMAHAGAVGAARLSGRTGRNDCTVAVLGCGIDMTYPPEHTALRAAVEAHGAVITEFPPATPPEGRNFPLRNRIISGLSQGTVVVEADHRSGALITARDAILQGRDIFAVPGNVGDANTSGTNRLIRDGAAVALRARDVLDNYSFLYRDTLDFQRLTAAEKVSAPDDELLTALNVCTRPIPAAAQEEGRGRDPQPRPQPRAAAPETRRTDPGRRPSARPAPKDDPAPVRPASERTAADRTPGTDSDLSEAARAALTPKQRALFDALPLDHAVPVDYLTREGFSIGDVMAAMTVLEIKGLVVSLPGSLYARK